MSRLRSSTNCTVICDTPSVVTLLNSSMPWIVLMISSSGFVTLVSISSGEAPLNVVVTVMIGSSTLGNWSIPMSLKENQPSTTRNRLIIVANTGRRIQRSARPVPVRFGGAAAGLLCISLRLAEGERFALPVIHDHRHPVGQSRLSAHDHAFAILHAFDNFL